MSTDYDMRPPKLAPAPQAPFKTGTDWENYRQLKEGETIQADDECDSCADGWRDEPKWTKAKHQHPTRIGQSAPSPLYPSHRKYRRLLK